MKTPSFSARLSQPGKALIGTLLTIPAAEVAEILTGAGFDWFFVDLEHSVTGISEMQLLLQVIGERVDSIIRVPLLDEIWIKKALDSGAAGVMVPRINTAEDARLAVSFCKYPPAGRRSVGISRAQQYGAASDEYIQRANSDVSLIVQIEDILAVQNIASILAVEGISAALIGPYDLSASMGKMGRVADPEVLAAINQVRQACQAAKIPLGIFTTGLDRARVLMEEGYRFIAVSGDALMLTQAAHFLVKELKK